MLSSHPVARTRLDAALVGWLTTVDPEGQPQASAVWHIVDGDDLIVYSRPDATRLVNLASNPRVAYNLPGDPGGDHVLTMEGRARVDSSLPATVDNAAYMAKYGAEIIRIGWTHEGFSSDFSTPLRIEIERIRAW
jgi:PPOX class probable F420-dependent enzyme